MEKSSAESHELQLAIFAIGNEDFGVEIRQVIEIIKLTAITPLPKVSSFVEGLIDLRGRILPIIDLAKRLNLKGKPHSEKTRIVVVEIEKNIVGMIVDEVTEVLRLPQDDIEDIPHILGGISQHGCIKGIGKLGNERLLILIDLAEVLSSEEIEAIKTIIR
ncbi:MAG: hypothetical protein A2Y00_04965 [Omnitrophica WOR_2 bacterium GWF2_43_52]|nr:MAG: hypothetical protein A2062_07280 [Omnitrophica WOR_2 bacterium GWA2_44_7]OGX17520.1 MAG: hypothetical protein A2Y01_01795 [Omnitrophica WOR_2 bacterium GWC2_44_8]OGX20458.1 MAG: hypothetical protein A2Y00_04965 [Omnitrophica WOR_2 bacterium GWF2_43_52]OGX53026.1 MAG: hypothetical protein A2460_06445 [Omnitrophica WOR_2 bacterium RIFOXYC2_FULL_43_9]HAH20512.1 chemotaxis protein CheW [Candidatus Omnitrophota bacterium]